jgi:glycyl-tRNA synthetase beta chain
MNANLLVELFTEELPPKSLQTIGEAFARKFARIDRSPIGRRGREWQWFATPRRLAIHIRGVAPNNCQGL